ncbi:MAG: TetR/AcrR family transcriptional regulator [Myxococcota bacterium]|nr:TetR/AcrR family transcriptional regulator [Myxococcota bacterium]
MPDGSRGLQRRSLETRDRLVDAAVREFAEKGFGAASTRAIAGRAGVAQSAVPYHFTTKEALWRAAANRLFGAFREQFAARIAGLEGVDAGTRVRLLLLDFVRFAAAHPELHRFMLQEGTGPSERLEWLVATHVAPILRAFRDAIAELEASGRRLPGRPEHLFYMMVGAGSTPYALAPEFELATGEDPFAKPMVDAHAEAVLRMFLPDDDPGAEE